MKLFLVVPFLNFTHWCYVSFAFNMLRKFLPEEKVEAVKGLTITADKKGAVLDVPADDLDTYLSGM